MFNCRLVVSGSASVTRGKVTFMKKRYPWSKFDQFVKNILNYLDFHLSIYISSAAVLSVESFQS